MVELVENKRHLIIKRDGSEEPYDYMKIYNVLLWACEGNAALADSVLESLNLKLYDRMPISVLVDEVIDTVSNLTSMITPQYDNVAKRLYLQKMYKELHNMRRNQYPNYYDILTTLEEAAKIIDVTSILSVEEIQQLNAAIVPERDLDSTYLGLNLFFDKYSIKVNGKPVELLQHGFMRLAIQGFLYEEESVRVPLIIQRYNDLSTFVYTEATPKWLNSLTHNAQMASCFPASQEIMTPTGTKYIDEISIGDKVFTENNIVSQVTGLTNKPYNDTMYSINTYSTLNDRFTCTKDHRIKVLDPVTLLPKWRKAEDIMLGDKIQIGYPTNTQSIKHIIKDVLETSSFKVVNGLIGIPKKDKKRSVTGFKTGSNTIILNSLYTPEFARLLGYYLGDGSILGGKRGNKGISIVCNNTETSFIADLLHIGNVLGVTPTLHSNTAAGNCTYVQFGSKILGYIVHTLIGKGFATKTLSKVLYLDVQLQKQLFIGAIRSDGCINANRASIQMSNITAIQQLYLIGLRLGLYMHVGKGTKTDAHTIQPYKVSFTTHGPGADLMLEVGKNSITASTKKHNRNYWVNGNYYSKVSSINSSKYKSTVYDFEVHGTHSFTANNLVVHNCCLHQMADNSENINKVVSDIGQYSRHGGGNAVDMSSLRMKGSTIGIAGKSSGPIPFIQKVESSIVAFNQLGARPGACVVTFQWWHADILELLELKDEGGNESKRARKLQYSIKLNRLFLQRLQDGTDITLFDPKVASKLLNLYGEEFDKEYLRLESLNLGTRVLKSSDLAYLIAKIRAETGNLYIFFDENSNEQSPFNAKITQSNLCQEIHLPTVASEALGETLTLDLTDQSYKTVSTSKAGLLALCNLSSINIAKWDTMTVEEQAASAYNLLRASDNLIDWQYYPVKDGEMFNRNYRAIGIGMNNLAYHFASKDIKYSDEEAKHEMTYLSKSMKTIFTNASEILALERGNFPFFHKTNLTRPSRFSTLFAIAPTATSSIIIGATEGIEPVVNLISEKTGTYSNKQLAPDLINLRGKYELAFDIPTKALYDLAAIRQKYLLDQGQSLNTYTTNTDSAYDAWQDIIYAEKIGLKSLYYLQSKNTTVEVCESCSA